MQGTEFEREVIHRLPGVLAELFDEPAPMRGAIHELDDHGVDAMIDAGGPTVGDRGQDVQQPRRRRECRRPALGVDGRAMPSPSWWCPT